MLWVLVAGLLVAAVLLVIYLIAFFARLPVKRRISHIAGICLLAVMFVVLLRATLGYTPTLR